VQVFNQIGDKTIGGIGRCEMACKSLRHEETNEDGQNQIIYHWNDKHMENSG